MSEDRSRRVSSLQGVDPNPGNEDTMNTTGSPLTPFRLTALLAVGFTVVLVSGCGVGGPSSRPTLAATIAGEGEVQEIDVSSGPETILFEGNITTDNTCQQIRAELDRFNEGQGIVDIAVEAETLSGCPNDEVTTWNYLGRMVAVDPGDYDVTVEHRFTNSDRESAVVFDGTVTVPGAQ